MNENTLQYSEGDMLDFQQAIGEMKVDDILSLRTEVYPDVAVAVLYPDAADVKKGTPSEEFPRALVIKCYSDEGRDTLFANLPSELLPHMRGIEVWGLMKIYESPSLVKAFNHFENLAYEKMEKDNEVGNIVTFLYEAEPDVLLQLGSDDENDEVEIQLMMMDKEKANWFLAKFSEVHGKPDGDWSTWLLEGRLVSFPHNESIAEALKEFVKIDDIAAFVLDKIESLITPFGYFEDKSCRLLSLPEFEKLQIAGQECMSEQDKQPYHSPTVDEIYGIETDSDSILADIDASAGGQRPNAEPFLSDVEAAEASFLKDSQATGNGNLFDHREHEPVPKDFDLEGFNPVDEEMTAN